MDGLLVLTLLWIVGAMLCAFVAATKGRSILGWAFLGLIIPVLSLLALIAVPNKREQRQRDRLRQRDIQNSKECPKCAETVKRKATICRYCGHKFS